MSYGVRIECWGDYACFTRPEMKVERVSYDIMTPSAARGLVEAIYWHPGLRYVIDAIGLMSPIQFTNVRRNEVKSKITASEVLHKAKDGRLYLDTCNKLMGRTQRSAMILKDVHYYIDLHFKMTEKLMPVIILGNLKKCFHGVLGKGSVITNPIWDVENFRPHLG